MIRISITDNISRELSALRNRVYRPESALREVTNVMMDATQQRFDREGPNWAPLTQYTIERRRAKGYPAGPILTMTGKMRGRIRQAVNKGVAMLLDFSPYGHQHHTGRWNMPARRFFVWDDGLIEKVQETVAKFIAGR